MLKVSGDRRRDGAVGSMRAVNESDHGSSTATALFRKCLEQALYFSLLRLTQPISSTSVGVYLPH